MTTNLPKKVDELFTEKALSDKIIVPLDGSKLAEIALPYAEELGVRTGSDIVLLSVIEYPDQTYRSYLQKTADITKRHSSKYAVVPHSKEVDVYIITKEGNPAEAIIDYAGKWGNNLIVMATHGRSGIGRWTIGSVADKVVRAATDASIMLIRGKKSRPDIRQKRLFKKALVPLDGSILSEEIIPHIIQFGAKLDLELTLCQIMPTNGFDQNNIEAYLQNICRELEQQGINTNPLVGIGSPADQIIDLADDLAFDLVAMSTRGQTNITPWSIGSVAQKVLLAGSTPLLLVKQN